MLKFMDLTPEMIFQLVLFTLDNMEIHDEKTYFIQPCCSEECLTTQRGSGDPFLYLKHIRFASCSFNNMTSETVEVARIALRLPPFWKSNVRLVQYPTTKSFGNSCLTINSATESIAMPPSSGSVPP
ncbi:hypothetical protein TNCV_3202541 [Trichonephila clavipes]|nr:hypothetical protein TNCV_3202541 [Trichonephila clavipes]